jgi:cytochrome c peroxidase
MRRLAIVLAVLFLSSAWAGDPPRRLLEEIKKDLDAKGAHDPYLPTVPLGLDQARFDNRIPDDSPLTKAKIELGSELYFDGRLSRDGTVSCASCHSPAHGFSDPGKLSKGVDGQLSARHAPTVINRVYGLLEFWDGRAMSLEAQTLGPIENPAEMDEKLDDLIPRLNAIEGYRVQFERVFGGPATKERLAQAIAAFERTILCGNSRVDKDEEAERWKKLDLDALSPEKNAIANAAIEAAAKDPLSEAERRGRALFARKARCAGCHAGYCYTDEDFHNDGVDASEGRLAISKDETERGSYKTPTLRGLVGREPYMHDGSKATLEDVVDFYDKGGGVGTKNLSRQLRKLRLTQQEKADLVAFLKALSGETTKVEVPRLP